MQTLISPDENNSTVVKVTSNVLDGLGTTNHVPMGQDECTVSIQNSIQFCEITGADNPVDGEWMNYGFIITVSGRADNMTQIYLPYIYSDTSYDSTHQKNMFIRSTQDRVVSSSNKKGWCKWRKVAFYDEIEYVINNVLKSKGLI